MEERKGKGERKGTENTENLEVSDHCWRSVKGFRPVVERMMGEMSDEEYHDQLLRRGLSTMVSDIILGHDVRPETEGEKKLLRTVCELFRKNPEEVSELILKHIGEGSETPDGSYSPGADNYR